MKIALFIGEILFLITTTFIYSTIKLSSKLSREEYEEENN